MTEAITPQVDVAFKKIFGVDENKDLLISLINAIVSEEDQVSQVTLLNPYNPKNFRKDKLSILDIKAEGQSGRRYNIEIQISDEGDYDKRALYYWGKLYTEQLMEGLDYSKLHKAIGIHILNFTSITETNKYHNVFHILEKDSHIRYFENLELHTIELRKFESAKSVTQNQAGEFEVLLSKAKTSLDAWVTFLIRHNLFRQKNLPEPLRDPCFKKALKVLENMTFTKEERESYEANLKWLRMEASALKKAEEKAEARGMARGIERGRQERQTEISKAQEEAARAQEETTQERKEKRRLIQEMLKKGIDVSLIMEMTGLTQEELKALQQE